MTRKLTEPRTDLVCGGCGKPPWWSLAREGDPCPDCDGHLVPVPEQAQEQRDTVDDQIRRRAEIHGTHPGSWSEQTQEQKP